jgi:N-succinyldiaminopimelate aminotransferase
VVFHSLSKRSNLPGLRSGFVAGDADVLAKFFKYRTYHGCAMPPATQSASIIAWSDEQHVADNRAEYRKKFSAVLKILQPVMPVQLPDASFYLWPQLEDHLNISDVEFAQRLYAEHNITVLPGSFLSREVDGVNPGAQHIRMALVAELENCIEAAQRIKAFVISLQQEKIA